MFRKIKRFALGRPRSDSWLDDKHSKVIAATVSAKGPHLHVRPPRKSHPLAGRRLIASHKPRAGSYSSRWSPISQRSSKMRSFSAPRKELKKRPYNFPRFEYDTNDDTTNDEVLFTFWKSRPLIELDIKIRTLENEPFKASAEEARQLRRVRFQLHDDQAEQIERRGRPRAKSLPRRRKRSLQRMPETKSIFQPQPYERRKPYPYERSQSAHANIRSGPGDPYSLPPHAVSGLFTGGNYPRRPTVQDKHRGFNQMSSKTQQMLTDRHNVVNRAELDFYSRSARRNRETPVDYRMAHVRQTTDHSGLPRQRYRDSMKHGYEGGLDLDHFAEEMPRSLTRQFRNARLLGDRGRQQESDLVSPASLEVWRQRQLDKKYHPKKYPPKSLPRQHQFGPQQTPQYAQEWRNESLKHKPFFPVRDHFSAEDRRPTPTPDAGSGYRLTGSRRPYTLRSAPVQASIHSVPADDVPAPRASQLAHSYNRRPYGEETTEQRVAQRRQREPPYPGAGGRNLDTIKWDENEIYGWSI